MTSVLAENYQLKWHSHGTHLHSSIATLHRSESFSDVTLATVDGRYVSAHKFILSACSSYLHQLFRTMGSRGSGPNLMVVLPSDISYRTLSILLQYMYSGEATVSNEQLNGVLKAGEILRIKGLCHNGSTKDRERETSRPSSNSSAGSSRLTSGMLNQHNEEILRRKQSNETKLPNDSNKNPSEGNNADNSESHSQKKAYSILKSLRPSTTEASSKNDSNNEVKMIINEDSNQGDNQRDNSNDSRSLIHLDKKQRIIDENTTDIEQNMQIELLVKEEPIEWEDIEETEGDDDKMLHSEMTIKPESYSGEDEEDLSEFYAPLTCDMCHETFTTPALWVRHIEKHPPSEIPRRKGKRNSDDTEGEFKSMRCDVCHEVYKHPADWVRHIEKAHTEEQLALSNRKQKRPVKQIIKVKKIV